MLGDYREEKLDNGLAIIGVQQSSLHSVACHARVHAGPRFEPREHAGLTHFLEHMIIQGSKNYPSSCDLLRTIEHMGGLLDASTHPESLEVILLVHKKHCEKGLSVFTDVLRNPLFNENEIEQEKAIVAQEISENRDDKQRNLSALELVYSLLFKEEVDELGTRGNLSVVQKFDSELVEKQYSRFFVPENMVVSMAGAFDFEGVCEMLDATLGSMPADQPIPEILREEVESYRARVAYRRTERTPVVNMALSFRAFSAADDRFSPMMAASRIIGGGLSSRLFTTVREELGLVYQISSRPMVYSDTGAVNITLSVDADNLAAAARATLDVIEEVRNDGLKEDELEAYKETIRCGMDMMCDRPDRLADYMARQCLLLPEDRIRTPGQYVKEQEDLTTHDLVEVIDTIFRPENANLAVVGPFEEKHEAELSELFPAEKAQLPGNSV
ncbi:MAG: M16 family metallopeptidase [Candidatus Brocadiia bacterium]